MRALTAEQFAVYARDQIAAAEQICDGHRQASATACSCTRQWPCSVVESCAQTRVHYLVKLAPVEATVSLPIVATAKPRRRRTRWRRLADAVLGGGHR